MRLLTIPLFGSGADSFQKISERFRIESGGVASYHAVDRRGALPDIAREIRHRHPRPFSLVIEEIEAEVSAGSAIQDQINKEFDRMVHKVLSLSGSV